MLNIYICAPLSGDLKKNLQNAIAFAKYALKECGAAPVVPHFYAHVLNDNDPKERQLAMDADLSLLFLCDEVWVFGNAYSQGMKEEIKRALIYKKTIKNFGAKKVRKILRKYGGNYD